VQSQQYIYYSPWKVTGNSEEVGILKANNFIQESMKLNWNFQGERGSNQKPSN